jgi:hypothetical protein
VNIAQVLLLGLRDLEDEEEAREFLEDETLAFTTEEKTEIKSWLTTCRGFTF